MNSGEGRYPIKNLMNWLQWDVSLPDCIIPVTLKSQGGFVITCGNFKWDASPYFPKYQQFCLPLATTN